MGGKLEKISADGTSLWSYDTGEGLISYSAKHRTIGFSAAEGVPPLSVSFGLKADSVSASSCNYLTPPAMGAGFALLSNNIENDHYILTAPAMGVSFALSNPMPVVSPMRVSFELTSDRITVGNILHAEPMGARFALTCDSALSGTRTLFATPIGASFALTEPFSVYTYTSGVWTRTTLISPAMGGSFALLSDGTSLISGAYSCVITGGPDGLSNVTVPISSFQSRLRNGDPSYLSVVVPNATKWLDYITARSNGEIVVYQGINELARVEYDYISYNEGGKNSNLQLTGYKTISSVTPKTVALQYVSVVALQQSGLKRITASVDFNVRPGDTVTWDGGSMTAGMIALAVSTRQGAMTITEAGT